MGRATLIITSKANGIKSSTRYFVPLGESLEIWQVTVTNESGSDADLSLFSAIEFCLWDANDDATNFQRNYSIGQMEIDTESIGLPMDKKGSVLYHKTEYRERRDHFAYFACSEPLSGFDTQREAFLGPYRGWDEPAVLENGRSCNSVARGWQPIGSRHVKAHLAAGESKQIIFILGYPENPKDDKFDPPGSQVINKRSPKKALEKYLQPANVEKAFYELREYWTSASRRRAKATSSSASPSRPTCRRLLRWSGVRAAGTYSIPWPRPPSAARNMPSRTWMPWAAAEPTDIETKIALICRVRGQFDLGQDFTYGIFDREEREVFGGTGLHTRLSADAREIGYWVREDRINRGIATETAAALTRVAFEVDRLDLVEIHCDADNVRSAAVPRKLGFT